MKKIIILMTLIVTVMFAMAPAQAAVYTTYTFSPSVADLQDLGHVNYYDWALRWSHGEIVNATISFYNLRDETPLNTANDRLYVHLLDTPTLSGIPVGTDASAYFDGAVDGIDNWAGQGPLIGIGTVPPIPTGWPGMTLTYDLRALGLIHDLQTFAADGSFGFGFDPDCHFVNSRIVVSVTNAVPEPGSLLLIGSGLLGFAFYMRSKK